MSNLQKVEIDIYDADGELCESIGGPMDYEDVREQMISIIRNDGIPVVRLGGAKPGNVKCGQSERVSEEQIDEYLTAINKVRKQMIVHAAFRIDGVLHSVTGPAAWVKERINEAVREMKKRSGTT